MTATYDLIASNVLTSSASSVTFSSIPATYRDLVLVADVLGTTTAYGQLQVNNDTTSANYPQVFMRGNGSSASSGAYTAGSFFDYPVFYSDKRVLFITQIMDYSATDKHKTALTRSNQSATAVEATAGRWANTAAISTVTFKLADIAATSSFYLYGIVS